MNHGIDESGSRLTRGLQFQQQLAETEQPPWTEADVAEWHRKNGTVPPQNSMPLPVSGSVSEGSPVGLLARTDRAEETTMHDQDVFLEMFEGGYGGFVTALGDAALRADPENREKIKRTFPEYFADARAQLINRLAPALMHAEAVDFEARR